MGSYGAWHRGYMGILSRLPKSSKHPSNRDCWGPLRVCWPQPAWQHDVVLGLHSTFVFHPARRSLRVGRVQRAGTKGNTSGPERLRSEHEWMLTAGRLQAQSNLHALLCGSLSLSHTTTASGIFGILQGIFSLSLPFLS